MRLRRLAPSALLAGLLAGAAPLHATDTRLLGDPAMSSQCVAFVYAEDLWICNRDGSNARRLTSHVGVESHPRFSPDGKTLAFTAQYDGNPDVYTIPVEGGIPRRLTWHPGEDSVQGFVANGSAVLFTSSRNTPSGGLQQLFSLPVDGGFPTSFPLPSADKVSISADGRKVAYTPLPEMFHQWKNYRGGTASRVWIYDTVDHSSLQIPQPAGRCNDTDPLWIGSTLYFRSDRNGEFNLFAFDPSTKAIRALTQHADFPVLACSAGADQIIYEQAGYLHVLDPATSKSQRLSISVAADLTEVRPRFSSGDQFLRNVDVSPTGVRAVVEFRGEIVTVPAKKGDVRNLTHTTGVHERSPVWSPDGQWIAYFSDASGEYELHVVRQDGQGGLRKFVPKGTGFYEAPLWSPDGKRLSYTDNSWSLYCLELETGDVKKIASEPLYGPIKMLHHSWAPDSRWIAYTRTTKTYFQQVHVYSIAEDKSWPITDGMSDVTDPVFDAGGKYLYFAASTNAGPFRDWFSMSNADMRITNMLYVTVLTKDEANPLAKESDEEKIKTDEEKEEKKEGEEKKEEEKSKDVRIDFEGIESRILALPTSSGYATRLQAGNAGQLLYLKSSDSVGLFSGSGSQSLQQFDLTTRKEETLAPSVNEFVLSADHKKALVNSGGAWSIVDAAKGMDLAGGKIAMDSIQVAIDPRAEWTQMFYEAWRINRDYFYAPNMHGCDWPAMRTKYEQFLPHCAVRSDLHRVIQWMCSELAVGHHYLFGGDRLHEVKNVPVGLLGADYEVHSNKYRFKRVYGGLNWSPELRAPLTEPGVNAKDGEYLLAVDGVDLVPPANLYQRFENTVGRIVKIKIGPNADGTDAREVSVVPIAGEGALRNRAWVEGNLRRVDEATNGRVAYVYVPNTSNLGHLYFKRYFFPQADRDAIIVDERYNGGGQVADYYIDILRRPYICSWATRYGNDFKTPLASIQGPKVMLINELAGSGGDLLPWMFHELKLGPLIGRPTWGGLVGILGFPVLLDGAEITSPNLAFYTEQGFLVENAGVPPDIEIEQTPADVLAGRDAQLEKAIEVVLKQLEEHPPKEITKPPYPVRARR